MKIERVYTLRCVKCRHHIRWEVVAEEDDWNPGEAGEAIAAVKCPRCGGRTDLHSANIGKYNGEVKAVHPSDEWTVRPESTAQRRRQRA